MSQEPFKNLPLELIINILSRLPLRAILSCKCVCKPWLDLLATREFATSHLPNSAPVVIVNPLRIFELDLNLDDHHHHYNPLVETRFPRTPFQIKGSANGLLLIVLLRARSVDPVVLFVCNPITRDYIELRGFVYSIHRELVTYGFGVSKVTRPYKVVRVVHDRVHPKASGFSKFECHVYTVGTGSWRSIQSGPPLDYSISSGGTGAFLNGNIHWITYDSNNLLQISCFDLETERFSTFSAPPVPPAAVSHHEWAKSLCALDSCLCLCDNSSYDEIVIWLMKEYGDEKSWVKELVIKKHPGSIRGWLEPDHPYTYRSYDVYPIKVFKDGDVLMAWDDFFFLYYSNKTKTTNPASPEICVKGLLHTPSFLSLNFFHMEIVRSF